MNTRPIILVTGATGAQGGSVAKALLRDDKFAVRIFTRYPSSPKALELKYEGVEIVQGDFEDTASLKKALQNVYGVFGVTSYWEHLEKEYEQGKNLINAVHQSDVKYFIFSTLDNYDKLSNGELPVPQYDIKASLQDYAKSLQLPASFIRISFYYENFLNVFPLQKDDDDNFWFGFPQGNTKLATVSVEDIGGIVASMFDHPNEYIGRNVQAVGSDQTCAEYAAILSNVLQRNVYYKYISREDYAGLDIPHAEEKANAFEVQRRYIPNRLIDMIESYALNPSIQEFKAWAIKNKGKFLRLINNQIQVMVD